MTPKMKAVTVLLLVLILAAALLSGCENNNSEIPDSTNTDNGLATGEPGTSSASPSIVPNQAIEDMTIEDYIDYLKALPVPDSNTLLFYTGTWSGPSEAVQAALHELLLENGWEYSVEFRRIPPIPFDQYVRLWEMLQAEGIPVDIFQADALREMAESGLLADMTEYLATPEGANLKEKLPEAFWETTEIDGRHYGIGNISLPAPKGWAVNKALMEKYHITAEDLAKPLWELEDVIKTVYEGEKGSEGFAACSFIPYNFVYHIPFTQIVGPVGVFHGDETVTAVNLFESDYIRNLAETLDRFRESGYYIEYDGRENFFMQLDFNGFPMFNENDISQEGVEVVRIPYFTTYRAIVEYPSVCAVSSWSEKKDWGFALLSFICQDADASNLLRYGIEGEDYLLRDGFAVPAREGQRVDLYYYGNNAIAAPVYGRDPLDKEKAYNEMLSGLEALPIDGFVFDPSPVQAQIDTVLAFPLNYTGTILCKTGRNLEALFGAGYEPVTVDGLIDKYNAELKKAGIDDIIGEMNRQIKEYLDLP